jgi:hypothetical protein
MTVFLVVKEAASGFEEVQPGSSMLLDDVLHPWQITELWSDAELALIGLYRVPLADIPAGYSMQGYSFARNAGGAVEMVAQLEPLPPAPVTPRQIRMALSQIGLRKEIEDWVETQDIVVKDSWTFATQFERTHPLILMCASALNKSEAEIDGLFELARTL